VTIVLRRLQSLHRFLAGHFFYPALLSSALASVVLIGRVYLSGKGTYAFLVWNLTLAWVPYLCALWAVGVHRRFPWWALPVPFAVWLIFFPNAPYIVTDFLHLQARRPIPIWYDTILVMSFAWSGCFLAVTSLYIMQTLVRSYLGRSVSWLFVAVTLGLTGLGVYLGRFLDWNSWDLLLRPRRVLGDVLVRFLNPLDHLGAVGVTVLFAAFLFVCYVTFLSMQQRDRV